MYGTKTKQTKQMHASVLVSMIIFGHNPNTQHAIHTHVFRRQAKKKYKHNTL